MALPVVQFLKSEQGSKTTFYINESNLFKIMDAVGERPLCIISICGPSNSGKSFLLNYILRYLEAIEKNKDCNNWMDLGNRDKPLKDGFPWGGLPSQQYPITKGICFWEKPFILKNLTGCEFAVLLMDTQGHIAGDSFELENQVVTGLCMLLSSVTIFNVPFELAESTINCFKPLCEFAQKIVETRLEKPFQSLKFLVREYTGDLVHGNKGGQSYLCSRFLTPPSNPIEQLEPAVGPFGSEILKYVTNMDCTLFPAIGKEALLQSFDGSWDRLDWSFSRRLEHFIKDLIGNDVVPRRVCASTTVLPFSGATLYVYLHGYIDMFNSSDTYPSAESFSDGIVDIHRWNCDWAFSHYRINFDRMCTANKAVRYLQQDDLLAYHTSAEVETKEYCRGMVRKGNLALFSKLVSREFEKTKVKHMEIQNAVLESARKAAFETFRQKFNMRNWSEAQKKDKAFILTEGENAERFAFIEFSHALIKEQTERGVEKLFRPIKIKMTEVVTSKINKNKATFQSFQKNPVVDKATFNCPICIEIPKGIKVFQCKNGHVICETCCNNVRTCPQCRVGLTGDQKIRNRAIEEILQNLNIS